MKLTKSVLLLAFAASSLFASAEIKPIPPNGNSDATKAARSAVNIYGVTTFEIGEISFKAVEMNSALNGDLNTTVILVAGKYGLGGEAGYDAAFQILPTLAENELYTSMESVKVFDGKILFSLVDFDGNTHVKAYKYDADKKTLIETGI